MITLYARQQKRHRCKEQTFGLCGEGEGGMIWENGIETCIVSYKKLIASLGSMQDTGCLGLVHWDNPEGWYGEGGGRGVQEWELMYTCGGFQYCKVKKKKEKKKKERKKEIKICTEMNENENKTTQNLWDSVKAVLRRRFIAIQAYLKKQTENSNR